jgi:hypothetical protein
MTTYDSESAGDTFMGAVAAALTQGQGVFSEDELQVAAARVKEDQDAGERAASVLDGQLVVRVVEVEGGRTEAVYGPDDLDAEEARRQSWEGPPSPDDERDFGDLLKDILAKCKADDRRMFAMTVLPGSTEEQIDLGAPITCELRTEDTNIENGGLVFTLRGENDRYLFGFLLRTEEHAMTLFKLSPRGQG